MLSYRSASPGYWTGWLLPLAIILSNPSKELIVIVGTVLCNTLFLCILDSNQVDLTIVLEKSRNISLLISVAIFNWFMCLGNDPYPLFTYISLTFAFPYVFNNIIKYCPRSFTFGEALIVTQTFLLTFWNCVTHVPTPPPNLTDATTGEIVILFAEAGFLGVMIVTRLLVIAMKPWNFSFAEEFFCVWGKSCLVAMTFRLSIDDMWYLPKWLAAFIMERIILFSYCVVCVVLAFGFVYWKNMGKEQASSMHRKYFHFLILAVYLPGILIDREFLYLGSAAVMYIFVLTELLRSLRFKIFGNTIGEKIDESVGVFRDRQDEGRLIVTPLYLLAGCSLPIWLIGLHTSSEDLNEYDLAASMAGLISIGVGDTFASIGGTAFGNIRWRGTNKSFGGTVFCITSQIIFTWLLFVTGVCSFSSMVTLSLIIAAFVNSLVEALTDQIDNLILPLLTFNIVLCTNFIVQFSKWAIG